MQALGFGPDFRLNQRGADRAVFDFTGGVLLAGAGLTRASAATRCDASGALVSAAADVARFDYDPVGHALKGLLIEPAAINVALNSQDLTQASWSAIQATASAGAIIENGATNRHRAVPVAGRSLTAGTPMVASCLVSERAGSAKRYFAYQFAGSAFTANPSATFDAAAGTVGVANNCTAGIQRAPGGWLCWLTATPAAATSDTKESYYLTDDAAIPNSLYAGDGASGLNVGEMQVEAGSAPTSRVRAGAAAATRAADVLTLAGPSGTWRFTFDDGSTQDVALTASGGVISVPTNLNRAWIGRAEKI